MISVVIPLYNKEISIVKTIKSVLEQTYKNFEIIIVNDGSTDRSWEIAKQIEDNRIRIISQSNSGVSKARNEGIKEAKYEFIALLDADDLWEPNFLEEMVLLIKDFPYSSLFGCTCTYIYPNGQQTISNYGLQEGFRGYVENYFEIGIENTLFNSSSVVFNKNAFFEIGKYDEKLKIGEDMDLWFRFALNKRIAFINKPLTCYLLGAENRAMTKEKVKIKNECLIWNLEKYEKFELDNPMFKTFIDYWRYFQITDFLEGKRNEINEITSLLRKMNLNSFPFFWTIMLYSPQSFHHILYKSRMIYKKHLVRLKKNLKKWFFK